MDMVRHPDPYFSEPQELPSGWWEATKPLAEWVLNNLKAAYNSGYSMGQISGQLDTLRSLRKRKAGKSDLTDITS